MAKHDPKTVATECLFSWANGDLETTRSLVANNVTFRGPLGQADGRDEYMAGLERLMQNVDSIVQRKVLVDGNDVCIIYDLVTKSPTASIPTVGWYHVRNGKVASVRAFFDARALTAPN